VLTLVHVCRPVTVEEEAQGPAIGQWDRHIPVHRHKDKQRYRQLWNLCQVMLCETIEI
jgi:hypothetical protein